MTAVPGPRPWWDEGVVYQVYVRSFADGDGDGVGDLEGVRRRLDHLAWLGVDAVWLSPIHPSPNADWGYDVADYTDVAEEFGGLGALDRLLADAERRGVKIVLDLVPNHTSDRHPWFVDARSGRGSRFRGWYVWADPGRDGGPPNNWRSTFGGSAWELDTASGQYYLHLFLREQPDLNWWNDEVRDAFDDILRFWFERGVAGFRIDVVNAIVHDRELRDDPPTEPGPEAFETVEAADARGSETFSQHRPEVIEILRRWRRLADAYEESRVLLGETWARDLPDLARYYDDGAGLHLAFNFAFATAPFEGDELRRVIEATDRALGDEAWPVWTASNHDIGRLATRWGDGDPDRIRCALFVLLLLRGTPVLYAGDEIGLPDMPVPPERRLDDGRRSDGSPRDAGRTPMLWTAEAGHGFTEPEREPWLPFGDPHPSVAEQRDDPNSILRWCRSLIALRRSLPELRRGSQRLLPASDGVLVWSRRHGDGEVLLAANVNDAPARLHLGSGDVLLGDGGRRGENEETSLSAWGSVAVRVT